MVDGQKEAEKKIEALKSLSLVELYEYLDVHLAIVEQMHETFNFVYERDIFPADNQPADELHWEKLSQEDLIKKIHSLALILGNALMNSKAMFDIVRYQGEIIRRLSLPK